MKHELNKIDYRTPANPHNYYYADVKELKDVKFTNDMLTLDNLIATLLLIAAFCGIVLVLFLA